MTAILYYTVPKPIRRPFVRGEIVETCDRDLSTMGTQRVVYAGKRIVRTACGRRWCAKTGWWMGEHRAYPFPSIRHAKKAKAQP